MTTTITRSAFAAAVEAGQKRASPFLNTSSYPVAAAAIVEAAFASAGITVRDPDPAPPAVVRISRAAYEAGALAAGKAARLWRGPPFAAPTNRQIADAFLSAAGIEVEPERTPEERLAELEAQRAAFLSAARDLVRCQGEYASRPPVHRLTELTTLVERHLGKILDD